MEDNNTDSLNPELKAIVEFIHRYNAIHPESCFVYSFIGLKKSEEKCEDCGEYCDCVDGNKSILGAFGDLDSIRAMLNDIRDLCEDNQEDGFVNI